MILVHLCFRIFSTQTEAVWSQVFSPSIQKWPRSLRYSVTEVFVGNKVRRHLWGWREPRKRYFPWLKISVVLVCVFWLGSIHLQLSVNLTPKQYSRWASRHWKGWLLGLPRWTDPGTGGPSVNIESPTTPSWEAYKPRAGWLWGSLGNKGCSSNHDSLWVGGCSLFSLAPWEPAWLDVI